MSTEAQTRRAIERLIRVPPPPGLLRRLLAIPAGSPATGGVGWGWLAAPVAFAAIAAAVFVLMPSPKAPEQTPEEALAAQTAVRDFTIAMTYLQKTAVIAERHTRNEIGDGMIEALTLSRDALVETYTDNGG
jgi:hypothetical protein